MSTFDRAPCVGKHDLFDSVDLADHALAREICADCPIQLDCARRLGEMIRGAGYYGHPEGTWAGRLVIDGNDRNQTRRRARAARADQRDAEEAAYTDAEALQAHSAYSAGDKSIWASVGHRVYGRRQKRRLRAAQSEQHAARADGAA